MCSDTICIAVPSDHLLNKVAIITGTDGRHLWQGQRVLMPGEAWVIMNDIDPHINDWFRFTATFPELGMLQVSACHG